MVDFKRIAELICIISDMISPLFVKNCLVVTERLEFNMIATGSFRTLSLVLREVPDIVRRGR